jgi:DNA repair protein RecN (Recombination protein N)
VLAISHLAQIAACAHQHIVVEKASAAGYTTADTTMVTGEARVTELARMLGGDADREVSRAHARELLGRGEALPVHGSRPSSDMRSATLVSAEETRETRAARGGRARGRAQ